MATIPRRDAIHVQVAPEMLAAERLFVRDLPGLLKEKAGRWLAYTPEGCIAEGDDELALFQECARRGLARGLFLIARVEPDAPVAEVSEQHLQEA